MYAEEMVQFPSMRDFWKKTFYDMTADV